MKVNFPEIGADERGQCIRILREIKAMDEAHQKRMDDLETAHVFCRHHPLAASAIVNEKSDGFAPGAHLCASIHGNSDNARVLDFLDAYRSKSQALSQSGRGRPRRKALSVFEKLHIKLIYHTLIKDKRQPVKHTKAKRLLSKQFGIGLRHVSEVLAETSKGVPTDERVPTLMTLLE